GEHGASLGDEGMPITIGRADAVHPGEAQKDFAVERNLTSDKPGIATLRHDTSAGFRADGKNPGHLCRGGRLEQKGGLALVFAAPLFQMRRDLSRVCAVSLSSRCWTEPL